MIRANPPENNIVFNKLGICISGSPLALKSKTYRIVSDNYDSVPMDIEELPMVVSSETETSTNSVCDGSKSASPLGFDEELDDADVEELLLRKQLLVSALNQCDEEEKAEEIASPTAEPFGEDSASTIVQEDGEDEEESALRVALLGSLRSDVEEADLRSSLMGSLSLESDLRAALLGGSPAESKETPSPASQETTEVVKEVLVTTNKEDRLVIRSTKITMSLQEIASTTKYAPKIDPVIIPLCDGESSSDENEDEKQAAEPTCKKAKIVPPEKHLEVMVMPDPKNLHMLKRIIAVKQADVARAEQLVDHLKKKLKNAEQILDINKRQLKMYREKEISMLNSMRNSPIPSLVTKLLQTSARSSPEVIVALPAPIPISVAKQPTLPVIFYAHGSWLNFDEFLPALHLLTLASLRDETSNEKADKSNDQAISLRWLLLTNQNAPSLDFLRTLLFTNYFHAISCPYDLTGECRDRKCPYEHAKMGVDWILLRLASLCPQALGLSEQDLKDKQVIRTRIQSVLSKFHHGKNKNNERDLVDFVWTLVRNALLAEFNSKKQINFSRRVSAASANDQTLSILSDQDVNQVFSNLTSSVFSSKKGQSALKRKFVKSSVPNRIGTLCQILKCRLDFSPQMAITACFSEFVNAKDQLEVADFLLQKPTVVLSPLEPSAAVISSVILAASIFKINLILTSNLTVNLANFATEERQELVPEDCIYLRMVLMHALCFQNVPGEFFSNIVADGLSKKRPLFVTNFWSEKCQIEAVSSQIENLLTSCVSSCQNLAKKQQASLTLDQSKLIFSVLGQALTYRLWKAMRDTLCDHARARKTCEKFFAKLCYDFPRFSVALTLTLAHQFAHFLSPSQAIDFLSNSPITQKVRLFPSVIYFDTLLRLSICENRPVLLPQEEEIAMISRHFDPGDGCGVLGVSEHFFLSLLRVFCADRARNGESLRLFTKSIYCSSTIEKLMVTLSFAVRTLLAARSIDEVFARGMVSPYFNGLNEVSTQKQRIQLMAYALCSKLGDPESNFDLLERTLDATCLSNEFLLDRMIDKMELDLTYLAGLACRLSCELQLRPRKPRSLVTSPCQDAIVRLISVLSSPNSTNSGPQTRAVVIHSAFRLASCCLVHHPYDARLWKLLFMCQRSLSSKFDPLHMYCRLLSQLGLTAPM